MKTVVPSAATAATSRSRVMSGSPRWVSMRR
jgi:hypothetical protein